MSGALDPIQEDLPLDLTPAPAKLPTPPRSAMQPGAQLPPSLLEQMLTGLRLAPSPHIGTPNCAEICRQPSSTACSVRSTPAAAIDVNRMRTAKPVTTGSLSGRWNWRGLHGEGHPAGGFNGLQNQNVLYTVKDLKALWRTSMGSGANPNNSGQAQILHYDGTLYVINGANDVYAIDVDSFISHRISLDDVNRGFELMEAQDGIRSVIHYD